MNTGSQLNLNRYKNLRPIGGGGMAEVYVADMVGSGGFRKQVALKFVHPHLTREPSYVERFIGEARLGGHLSHPNLVEVLDFGDAGGRLVLVMEYVDGPNLSEVLQHLRRSGQEMPLEVALSLGLEICTGLAYAHEATGEGGRPLRMVHRDLKPGNILLSARGKVKIADFGVARATSNVNATMTSAPIGTPRYMSPEQAASSRDVDHRSDLFSVGLILFELLTLAPVYHERGVGVVLLRAKEAELEPRLATIPASPHRDALLAVLRRCLARDPEHRFPSASAAAEAIEDVLHSLKRDTTLRAWLAEHCPQVVAEQQLARAKSQGRSAEPRPPDLPELSLDISELMTERISGPRALELKRIAQAAGALPQTRSGAPSHVELGLESAPTQPVKQTMGTQHHPSSNTPMPTPARERPDHSPPSADSPAQPQEAVPPLFPAAATNAEGGSPAAQPGTLLSSRTLTAPPQGSIPSKEPSWTPSWPLGTLAWALGVTSAVLVGGTGIWAENPDTPHQQTPESEVLPLSTHRSSTPHPHSTPDDPPVESVAPETPPSPPSLPPPASPPAPAPDGSKKPPPRQQQGSISRLTNSQVSSDPHGDTVSATPPTASAAPTTRAKVRLVVATVPKDTPRVRVNGGEWSHGFRGDVEVGDVAIEVDCSASQGLSDVPVTREERSLNASEVTLVYLCAQDRWQERTTR